MTLPLTGVTVLAVKQYGAGPFGTMLLGDLGAEVIKIENPADGGDMARAVGPHFLADGSSQFFHAFNRNKRSLTLNLKAPEGREIFLRLVAEADAVLNNLRGDLPEALGLDYATLGKVNPAIVCAHLSAYGRDGPRRTWPGYDYLMQAEAGYLSLTGEPDAPPARFGLSMVDMMTGLTAAFALTSGIIGARASGKGMDLDTSLFDTALHNLSYLATWYLNAGVNQGREPRSAHPSLTPSQLYRTGDGWLFVMCNKEKFWPLLAEALGHPEWAADPRFASFAARLEHRAEVTEMLDAALSEHPTAAWLERLGGIVPVAPVNDVAEALENPFVADRGRVAGYAGPDGTEMLRMLAGPVRVGGAEQPRTAGPELGADTGAILRRLGLGEAEIEALRAKGVV
ncbi:MAG: CoA transferase [Proteobacteria bacterium]|nr:CoA transferase [Pseudomonadota bacterium]